MRRTVVQREYHSVGNIVDHIITQWSSYPVQTGALVKMLLPPVKQNIRLPKTYAMEHRYAYTSALTIAPLSQQSQGALES